MSAESRSRMTARAGGDTGTIDVVRYTMFARINHWIIGVSFTWLAVTGLALFHPALYFLTVLGGGGEATRILHPWVGVVLFVSYFIFFFPFWRLNLWTGEDIAWLMRMRDVLANREEGLPELGKYNAGQKMVFWSMSLFILLLLATGVVIWDEYFYDLTSIAVKRLAVLAHSLLAVLAILVWITHVYAVLWVRDTVRAMTRGSVTGGWAWRHHRRWLREQVAKGEVVAPPRRRT